VYTASAAPKSPWLRGTTDACHTCRWLADADQWGLPTLTSTCIEFIAAQRRADACNKLGVADKSGIYSASPTYALSFKAMLRSGSIHEDLQKLSAPTLLRVMQAGLTGKGCAKCTGSGKYECMCVISGLGSLHPCTCNTRSKCSQCGGWLDP
jgi:hypothetical protein